MELRVFMEVLLEQAARIDFVPHATPVNAKYPASGFYALPLVFSSARSTDA
jgi:hypothetical protein